MTTESVADTLNISVGSKHNSCTEFGTKQAFCWMDPQAGTTRSATSEDRSFNRKLEKVRWGLFCKILRRDEAWLHQHNPQDKIQSKQWVPWGRSGAVKAKSESLRGKVMATVSWDAERFLPVDFLENKKIIISAYYEGIFRKLSKKSRKNTRESCINASSSTTTMHLLMVLCKQELCYENFNGKSSYIPLTAPI